MLAKIYKTGALRQRVLRGFCVTCKGADLAAKVVTTLNSSVGEGGFRLSSDGARRLSVDTGLVWLGTEDARRDVFARLAAATREVQEQVASLGGSLLTSGLHLPPTIEGAASCGDSHFVETSSSPELEVLTNLLRLYSPVLIALSGKAYYTQGDLHGRGSYRLINSGRHYSARYFASVSSVHLERIAREFRRDSGLSRIDLLDVVPGEHEGVAGANIRCIDSQILLPFTRSHALIVQAIALRARRTAREGRRIGLTPQHIVSENRARAIALGFETVFGFESRRDLRARPGSVTGLASMRAEDAALDLLIDLIPEFQALEATFEELRPAVLGLSYRRVGLYGIRCENDLVSAHLRHLSNGDSPLAQILGWLRLSLAEQEQLLVRSAANPAPSEENSLRRWWEAKLRERPRSRAAERGQGSVPPGKRPPSGRTRRPLSVNSPPGRAGG